MAVAYPPIPFLTAPMRTGLRIGGRLAPLAPWLSVPITRAVLRSLVGHLVLDSRGMRLTRGIRRLRRQGAALNVNLLGEAVLGKEQAAARLAGTLRLVGRLGVTELRPPRRVQYSASHDS